MAQPLTDKAKSLLEQTNIVQQLILEIDGFTEVFGALPITVVPRYGDAGLEYGDAGLTYGGVVEDPNSRPWIMLEGTTNSITQQIQADKGAATSVSTINVSLIDKNAELTNIFSPGVRVPDVIGREANFYVGQEGGSHPEDSVKLFSGVVTGLDFGAGKVVVKVSHPEQLKRQDVLIQATTKLSAPLIAGAATASVEATANFIAPLDVLESYAVINDEIFQWTGKTSTTLTGLSRGALDTSDVSHSTGDEVVSFYRFQEDPIDLALKIYLSNGGTAFVTEEAAIAFNQVDPSTFVTNAIAFQDLDIQTKLGLIVGDTITVTGASEAANNATHTISSFGSTDVVSYIVVTTTLTTEVDSPALADFTSKFNVLPADAALGMNPKQVDVQKHLDIQAIIGSIPDYDLYVDSTEKGTELINKKILFPLGMISIPRQGKVGLNATLPPLSGLETKTLDSSNVINPKNIKIRRTVNENFYNAIVFKVEKLPLEDKFLRGIITQSTDSTNRIPVGNKVLTLEAPGLRDTSEVVTFLQRSTERLLIRYRFGAEFLEIQTHYRTAFNLDVGDTVILDGKSLGLPDTTVASKDFVPRIFEIENKTLNVKTGAVKLNLIDTVFDNDRLYGTFGPASLIKPGATSTKLPLKRSFVADPTLGNEKSKWEAFVGLTVQVRSPDFTNIDTAKIDSIDPIETSTLNLDSALSFTPAEDDIIEMPPYTSAEDRYKSAHCFAGQRLIVVTGVSSTSFTVSVADAAKMTAEDTIRVHSTDFSDDSEDTNITSVVGVTVTVDDDMGFTPSAGDEIDMIPFADGGRTYAYF